MKKKYCFFKSIALSLVIALTSIAPINVFAAHNNQNSQNYDRWSNPVKSYINSDDKGFTIIDYSDTGIEVRNYDKNFKYLSDKTINLALPLFGGYYSGNNYNFIVFGQNNEDEIDSKEVFKVVKYDKNWEVLGEASLSNCNTTKPFEAGSLRMVEDDGILYIRTARQMYKSKDGLNHQSNITFSVDIEKMKIVDSYSKVMNVKYGYVSHSFNQFIDVVDNKLVAVDHGDAYPRQIVLSIYNTSLKNGKFTGDRDFCSNVSLLDISGKVGDNYTGATVGGFENGKDNFIVAGSSIDQNKSNSSKNIFVSVTSIKDTKKTELKWITNYTDSNTSIGTPHIVKIDDNKFVMMWNKEDITQCVIIDGSGNKISAIKDINVPLSDCKPILDNGKLIWYVSDGRIIQFYDLDLNDLNK